MVDFPTSLVDFQRRFPDEAACAAWLFEARWPTGFRCPACDQPLDHRSRVPSPARLLFRTRRLLFDRNGEPSTVEFHDSEWAWVGHYVGKMTAPVWNPAARRTWAPNPAP